MRMLMFCLVLALTSCLASGNQTASVAAHRSNRTARGWEIAVHDLIEAGRFLDAESKARSRADRASDAGGVLEEAIARKYIGVSLSRLGITRTDEARGELLKAQELLRPLVDKEHPEAKTQLGYVLLNLAQLKLYKAEAGFRDMLLSGIEMGEFELLSTVINPTRTYLGEARRHYPSSELADVELAEADTRLLFARYGSALFPGDRVPSRFRDARGQYRKAYEYEADNESRADTLAAAMIGKGISAREEAGFQEGEEKIQTLESAQSYFRRASSFDTKNREQIVFSNLYRATVMMDLWELDRLSPQLKAETELLLMRAAEDVEDIRAAVTASAAYETAVSFFSHRTAVYEQLVRYHALQNDSGGMLESIERMKARAFRDMLRDDGRSTEDARSEKIDMGSLLENLRRDGAVLAEFFYGPQRSWVVLVFPDGEISHVELALSGQDIVLKTNRVLNGYSSQVLLRRHFLHTRRGLGGLEAMERAFAESRSLYEKVFAPVHNRASEKNAELLYIVPHHLLHYVPFHGLVTELNEESLFDSRYYVESDDALPIAYLPSAEVLTFLRHEAAEGEPLIFARSDFQGYPPHYPTDLPNTVREARQIAEVLGSTVYKEQAASESVFWEKAPGASLIYFATHGILDLENPLDSSVLLAAADGYDGHLTVRELLYDLHGKLKADMVVLSACQTNRGEAHPNAGDDLATLSRAFLISGASSVIATQWDASDDTMPMLMGSFFERYVEETGGQITKARILSDVFRDFLSDPDSGVYRHPMFWACVVIIGRGN